MFPNKEQLEALRAKYPAGTKIILHHMDDPYPVPSGTVGEVQYVDDAGNIHTIWNNGRTLSVIECVDDFSKATGGAGVRWTPLQKAEAPTEATAETEK